MLTRIRRILRKAYLNVIFGNKVDIIGLRYGFDSESFKTIVDVLVIQVDKPVVKRDLTRNIQTLRIKES